MKETEGKRSGLLEKYKKFNIITLPIGVGVGVFGIFTGNPILVTGGFSAAFVDTAQIILIDRINKKKQNPKEQIVFQASGA
ncbi:MAG: hypothetical protein COU25_01005 [Candidatus Levybacteria bacterium CG10_big_fil_rev_8_21_14_0_10_35_13]|nr:MAG: hypothetical protein COU25_01005 [Candidatus Levybacteria bacterium CG10_big_fil_rev_8_21_14_0_10_35_13]